MSANLVLEHLLREPHVVDPGASCAEACRVMRDANVGAVMVTDDGRPLGIVTDRDVVVRMAACGLHPDAVQVSEIMTREAIFLTVNRRIDEALEIMRSMGVRKLPVVDGDGILVGLVTADDLLVAIASELAMLAANAVRWRATDRVEAFELAIDGVV